MQKFFITLDEFESKILSKDTSFQLINVLRSKVNDQFLVGVIDKTYLVQISKIENKNVAFEVIEEKTGNSELPFFVSLFQGYPKGDKLENIIKYGTQLGVHEFHPTLMKRSVFKLDSNKKDNKLERFNKIAKEAAEQSFRDVCPTVVDIKQLNKIDFSGYDIKILCYEESAKNDETSAFKRIVKSIKTNDKIAVIVGPEGGITPEEVEYLTNQGFISVGLGPRILRTETVVFYVLSTLSYEWELR
jgi:16S rRNA (uracil1498-N3)-methyltransferase